METWNKLLDQSEPYEHLLQFYEGDDRALLENISRYASEGLKSGEGVLIIAGADRNRAILEKLNELGASPQEAVRDGLLTLVEVHGALDGLIVNGQPDWELFQSSIGATVQQARERAHRGVIRAYGEMVGVLWADGRFSAAIRLEHYWNELRQHTKFKLFCAYPIDVLGQGFHGPAVNALLCTHTHLLPCGPGGHLEEALHRAMDEVLGSEADVVKTRFDANQRPSWAKMPSAEGMIVWLRSNLPEHADQIMDRVRRHNAAFLASPAY